ncbi:unnamed protein product [Notodromas monacha]|uniref:Exonuclease domain-containing protein n=1 Tax=Notodromas monacha TaxID=399045 RepID=A0A7R9G948_9CRUS|nr:unnamed protein product [Notodromas monacha]CAG0912783.1 unnamed protein product [Notodromas monacha]
MVYTTIGEEVATVCLVDGNGNVLIKENIKPMGVVTDYRTPFSGLTESELNEAVYSASEILKKMQDYIGPDTIIVGHGIDNDLLSLRIVHSNVVDTGLVRPLVSYTGTNRRKSLASRVQDAFNEDITVRAKGGPRNKAAEDAQYAMALARVDAASDPAARV